MTKTGYTIIEVLIALYVVCWLAFAGFVVFYSIKACSEIQDKGLKSVIEEIWEGK